MAIVVIRPVLVSILSQLAGSESLEYLGQEEREAHNDSSLQDLSTAPVINLTRNCKKVQFGFSAEVMKKIKCCLLLQFSTALCSSVLFVYKE